jgi:hypothetical protein
MIVTECYPQLIPNEPDQISVIFLGMRRAISKPWYFKVKWMANCSQDAFDKAWAKHRAGEMSELDEEFWK